jgi:hypothetical protein
MSKKIVAESLLQHDEKHVVLSPPSGIRVGKFFLLPLSHLVGSVQHVFHHIVIQIRQLFTMAKDKGRKIMTYIRFKIAPS